MKGDLSCQAKEVLLPPGQIFRRSARQPTIAAKDLITTKVIHSLLHGVEGVQCYTVELGDDIVQYAPELLGGPPGTVAPVADLYLVAAGAVRLLAENPHLQKTVSVAKLRPGEGFGCEGQRSPVRGDRLCTDPLPYRARAAAPSQIVRIPAAALGELVDRWPTLGSRLQRQFQLRSQLAFFKQCTPLGAIPSTVLSRQLLPRLIEHFLQAGNPLARHSLALSDCLWLREGMLVDAHDPHRVLVMGDRWSYPDSPGGDWVAQTDSLLYRLPLAPWEVEEQRRLR